MPRTPRSATIPVLLTMVVLAALTVGVANSGKICIQSFSVEAPGSPPVLRRGQRYLVHGVVDDGGNPYRPITQISTTLSTIGPGGKRQRAGSSLGDRIDRRTGRFSAMIPVYSPPEYSQGTLELTVVDGTGRSYGEYGRRLPGSTIPVRIE